MGRSTLLHSHTLPAGPADTAAHYTIRHTLLGLDKLWTKRAKPTPLDINALPVDAAARCSLF
jgi:hypothetical protein